MDTLMDVGSGVLNAAKSAVGYVADGAAKALGLSDPAGNAQGVAAAVGDATKAATGAINAVTGPAGELATTATEALKSASSTISSASNKITSGIGTIAGAALGAVGNTA